MTRTAKGASSGSRSSKGGVAAYGTAPSATNRYGSHRCRRYNSAASCNYSCGSATTTCGGHAGHAGSRATKACRWSIGWTRSRSVPRARTPYSVSRTSGGRGRRCACRTGTCSGTGSSSRRLTNKRGTASRASSTSTTSSCGAGPRARKDGTCSRSSSVGSLFSKGSSRTRAGRGHVGGTEDSGSYSPSCGGRRTSTFRCRSGLRAGNSTRWGTRGWRRGRCTRKGRAYGSTRSGWGYWTYFGSACRNSRFTTGRRASKSSRWSYWSFGGYGGRCR